MKTQEEVVRQHAVGPISIYKIYQEGYQDRELDDWDAFRREAAKDILPSIITAASKVYEFESLDKDIWCAQAVAWADSLVKHLKMEDKK